jgi:hypothetical protein
VLRLSPFRLMYTAFVGMAASLVYGLLSTWAINIIEGGSAATNFWVAYSRTFNTLIATGLAFGTALIVFASQNVIPDVIGENFSADELAPEYFKYRRRFRNVVRSMTFSASFAVLAFWVFQACQFPQSGLAEALMLIPTCAQWALGVYVGRKLFYAAMMLRSLLSIKVCRNLFRDRALDDINTYVHIAAMLTLICSYVHVRGCYYAPFAYQSVLGEGAKAFWVLIAFVGAPVLLVFNFYPRAVLNKLYSDSIDFELSSLHPILHDERLSAFEKRFYLVQFDRMARGELRHSLQLTLTDLPIGITILFMVLEPMLKG